MIPTSASHVCKIFQNFPIRRKLSLPFENVSKSPFFSFISLRSSRRAVYIYLVGGVVIFDELLAFTGIDIRVNKVHCPGFGDSEVNLAALLIYSKHMFADIHDKTS